MWPALESQFNRKSLRRTSEPAAKVISVADFKAYMKIDGSDEDTILGNIIDAATNLAEVYTKRAFITQTQKLTLDGFDGSNQGDYFAEAGIYNIPRSAIRSGDAIELPRSPIQAITSITTYNDANASSVFDSASYSVDTNGGRVYLNDGYSWPTNLRDQAAVEIVYTCGYGDASTDVPSTIITAVMMQAASMYECRGKADLTTASKQMLDAYKLWDDLAS